jgi:hypothetical protein
MEDQWYRWKYVPTSHEDVIRSNWWARTLGLRRPINDSGNWEHAEVYHSAPGADPDHYRNVTGVAMTYPIGRLFTVAGTEPISGYRAQSGLSVVQHFALNENDDNWGRMDPNTRLAQPFQNTVGYASVDVDRAGSLALLNAARAVAHGDPRNLAFLCASSFSTGFPLELRRFFLTFQAVPALPSTVLQNLASDPEVVLREIPTGQHGTYYLLVNPTWRSKAAVRITLPAQGRVIDLLNGNATESNTMTLALEPASLRAWQVKPSKPNSP